MGAYGKYMFNQELITWSIDGGGAVFYRRKHRFSVTNVSGYIAVNPEKINCKFLAYAMSLAHSRIKFDYTVKAHPSVIRSLYTMGIPISLQEQQVIGSFFSRLDNLITLHQETLDPAIRWTDRVHSGDGMWSGNLFDFFFRVNRKLAESLKTPFKLDGIFRVDDTPMHKAVREALANCLFNADYHGVRGVVVRRTPDKLVFENPGDIRTGIEQMRLGGVSDPRNGLVMKMFSLIDVGERAGTGVPDVFATWANAGLPEPQIEENFGEADRTILTLMLEADAKPDNNEQISDDYEQINSSNEQISDNNEQLNGLNEQITERQRIVLRFVEKSPRATYDDMARAAGVSSATVRRDAEILIGRGLLKRVGSRKAGQWEVQRGEES